MAGGRGSQLAARFHLRSARRIASVARTVAFDGKPRGRGAGRVSWRAVDEGWWAKVTDGTGVRPSWCCAAEAISVEHFGVLYEAPTRLDRRGPGDVLIHARGIEVKFPLSRLQRLLTTRPVEFSADWIVIRGWEIRDRQVAVRRYAPSTIADYPDLGIDMWFASPQLAIDCTNAARVSGLQL
jgi:hypothetical protein